MCHQGNFHSAFNELKHILNKFQMSNLSACNDEGITALHNAICAGHYEIVRYLIESHADVNAQV